MIAHDHGSTGIGGIAFAENDHLPPDYRGSVFLGNVVTGRVHRDTIRWQGSSPHAAMQPDLVISDDARAALIAAPNRVPARLQNTIAAGLAASRAGAEALLDAVAQGKASSRPLGEKSVAIKLQESGLPAVKGRLDALLRDAPPADGRILAVIADRRRDCAREHGGDPDRGAAVFAKNCAACHQIEGRGARVGP